MLIIKQLEGIIYDTRTNQEYEGPSGGPEEVSLTSITDDIRSMKRSNYR